MNDDDRGNTQEVGSNSIASDRPSNNGPTSQGQSPVEKNEDSSFEPPRARTSSMSLVTAAAGLEMAQGKQGSKHNAIKHGIFSKVVVLKNESRAEYRSLIAALVEYFEPWQAMEELLVEKLGALIWRHRRLIAAEAAEIEMSTASLEWDEKNMQGQRTEEMDPFSFGGGLIRQREDPVVLERCIELLGELRLGVESEGFDYEQAEEILTKIYGDMDDERLPETLFESFEGWKDTSTVSEEERKLEGYGSPTECKERALQEIDSEIRRLRKYEKVRALIESERKKLEVLRRGIPDAHRLDRLLRYEASLERAFDRTLSQLERLQRMRRGQPVPPPLDVKLST